MFHIILYIQCILQRSGFESCSGLFLATAQVAFIITAMIIYTQNVLKPYHAAKHRNKSKKSFKFQALTLPVLLPCLSVTERIISAANVSPSLI